MIEVCTNEGWKTIEDDEDVETLTCLDCPETAVTLTYAGRGPDGSAILWAHCAGCADESRACSMDAERQASYECE